MEPQYIYNPHVARDHCARQVSVLNGQVIIDFDKKGNLQGIEILKVSPFDESDFALLEKANETDLLDTLRWKLDGLLSRLTIWRLQTFGK